MQKIILLALATTFSISCFGKKPLLTPDLVISGGYLNYEQNNLFPEKIEGLVDYKISKDDLHKRIATFMFLNKFDIVMDKENRLVFLCKDIPVGTDIVSTPVASFTRSRSKVSFIVTIDIIDSGYKYEISDISTNRRVERVDIECLELANQVDIEKLKEVGFDIGTISFAGMDMPTKGKPNMVHWKRLFGMVAERNGYVNMCIKQGKTISGLKPKWIEKIKKMDARITSEIQLYKDEYDSVIDFLKKLNEKIIVQE